jgi:hypothetical protein
MFVPDLRPSSVAPHSIPILPIDSELFMFIQRGGGDSVISVAMVQANCWNFLSEAMGEILRRPRARIQKVASSKSLLRLSAPDVHQVPWISQLGFRTLMRWSRLCDVNAFESHNCRWEYPIQSEGLGSRSDVTNKCIEVVRLRAVDRRGILRK